MDKARFLEKVIDDLELKLENNRKMLEVIWNNAIKASMDQFGIEHKPQCKDLSCKSCVVRETLTPLLRDANLNRKAPREMIGEFMAQAMSNKKHIGKEKKAYIQGIHDLFEELIGRGIV